MTARITAVAIANPRLPRASLAPLGLAIHLALAAALGGSTAAFAQAPLQTARYDIAAGPLAAALNRFAQQAGVAIVVDASQVQGVQTRGLSGSYGVDEGFAALLRDTGYTIGKTAAGYVLIAAPAQGETQLKPVSVTASEERLSIQEEGGAKAGYRVKTISSLGALGSANLQDTPFSISVVSRELLQNMQAQSPDDIYKLNPSTRTTVPQITGWSPMVSIRGFTTYDTAEDGLRRSYNHAAILEDKERVEILNGLSGFMYGAAAPAGMVNYVSKRPTAERLNSVTVGNYGGSQYFVHGDFGGRIDGDGRTGYRLNVVKQKGDTAVEDQSIDRELVSGAFDWQLSDDLLLELNASHNKYLTEGSSAYWFYGPEYRHGKVPDADKLWSQPWIKDEFNNTDLLGRLTYRLSDYITLRGAYMRDFVERPRQDHTMNSAGPNDTFEQIRIHSGKTNNVYDAGQALADIDFQTGPLEHKVTLGYTMYSDQSWTTSYSPNTGWLGPYPLTAPTYVPEPAFPPDNSSRYYAGRVRNENYLIGDVIAINEQWTAMAGVNRSRILANSFAETGERETEYDEARNSPSFSLMYKPVPWLTTYASYIEGLEQGGVAPDDNANVPQGEVMPPMVSRQREIGVKASVGEMLLTAAVFDIEKAYEYTNSQNVYTQSGRQHHRGFEFGATGRVLDALTIVGGVTLLDTDIKGGEADGNEPMNVAEVLAKLYAEYELPFVPALSATGGIYYTGRQWADDANTDRLPGFTTLDLGLRYALKVGAQPVTLRLNVNNVTDKQYWLNSYYVGSPRSIAFSAQVQF